MVITMNKKIFTILLCFWPILNIYSYQTGGLLGFGDICVLVFALFNIGYCQKIRFYKEIKYYFIFMIAIIFLSLFDTCMIGDKGEGLGIITSVARVAFYSVIVIIYIPKCLDLEYGIRIIKWFTVANAVIVYLQTILYMLSGRVTLLILPVLPLANGETYNNMYNSLVAHSGSYYFRASGIFLEPAHLAQYVLIGILLFLYTCDGEKNVNDRKSFWLAFFCSGAAILSTSSIGIVFTILIWVHWAVSTMFKQYISADLAKNYAILIPICILSFIYIIRKLNVFTILFGKLSYVTITDSSSSFAYRVTRGFEIYSKLPIREKLFGVGFGNISSYMVSTSNLNSYAESDYMNSIAYIFCSIGIVGMILFILIFYKILSGNCFLKVFTLYVLALSCCASIFSSDIWVLFMGIYIMFDRMPLQKINGNIRYG